MLMGRDMMRGILGSNKGFGLVETMIAAGLGLVVIYFLSQSMVAQAQQVTYLESRLIRNQFFSELQTNYSDADFCKANFEGVKINGNRNQQVKLLDLNGDVLYDAKDEKKNIIDDKVRLDSIFFENPAGAPVPNNGSGWVELVVEMSIPALKRPLKTVRQKLFVNLSGNQVESCGSSETSSGEEDCPTFFDGQPFIAKSDPDCSCGMLDEGDKVGVCPKKCPGTSQAYKNGDRQSILVSELRDKDHGTERVYMNYMCTNGSWTNVTGVPK